MSPLWVLPLVVLALGSVVLAVAARRLATEAAALRPGLDDLRQLGDDARGALVDLEALRERGAEVGDLRARARAARRLVLEPGHPDVDR